MVERSGDDVKPLSPAEVQQWDVDVLFLVWLVARSTEDLVDGVLAAAGLSGDEYAVLSMLRAKGGTTPSELARWMAAPPTTVSAYVKRLTARGWTVRVPNPDDGRSSLVRLTEDGLRIHDTARRRFRPLREDVVERLAGDHLAIADALTMLRGVIDQLRAEPLSQEAEAREPGGEAPRRW